MEAIQNYNWSITIGLVLLLIAIIIGGAYFVVWYGKLQAKLANEYQMCYDKIHRVLEYEVCDQNYDWLLRLLTRLGQCKYKNREMTEVLTMEFFRKYEKIAKERVSQES